MSPVDVQPSLPYIRQIPGGLHSGKRIEIRGHVHKEAKRFDINLYLGHDLQNDRPLQISVRLLEGAVVRNSLLHNEWGKEERDGPFPFKKGQKFTLTILVEPTCYKIAVNGTQCYTFRHRVPATSVQTLKIEGHVDVERIEFFHSYEDICDPFLPTAVVRPPLPYQGQIPGGLPKGKLIEIRGHVHKEAKRFDINLCVGYDLQNDLPLHISVRLLEGAVVRNCLLHDEWGKEEKEGPFPFRKDRKFTLWILVEPTCYKISVDGEQCYTFNHRIPAESVLTLQVDGDVDIERIEFI